MAYYLTEISHDKVFDSLRRAEHLHPASRDGVLRFTDAGYEAAKELGGNHEFAHIV